MSENYNTIEEETDGYSSFKRKPTADELTQKYYKTEEPAPQFDQLKAERLRRMGKLNVASQGIQLLGDIAGNLAGGTVQRRQPDTTGSKLYNSYQNMLDNYDTQKTNYNYRKYRDKRNNLKVAIGRADRDEELQAAGQIRREDLQLKRENDTFNKNKWTAEQNNKKLDRAETERYHTGMLDKAKTKNDKSVNVETNRGTVNLKPEQISRMSAEILDNADQLSKIHSGWFEKQPVINSITTLPIPGQFTYKLSSRIKPEDLARDYLNTQYSKEDKKSLDQKRSNTFHLGEQNSGNSNTNTNPFDF